MAQQPSTNWIDEFAGLYKEFDPDWNPQGAILANGSVSTLDASTRKAVAERGLFKFSTARPADT